MSISSNVVLPKIRFSQTKAISPQIYEFLRKCITTTVIKPGSNLSENSISEQLRVSRQPVREALMRLSYESLITVLPQRGSEVSLICVDELANTIYVRAAIEKECAESFASLKPSQQNSMLKKIGKILEQQRALESMEDLDEMRARYLKLDDSFHEAICDISGSTLPWQTIQGIKGQMDRLRYLSLQQFTPISSITDEHYVMYEALKAGDIAKAQSMIKEHLQTILRIHSNIVKEYRDYFTPESLEKILANNAN